MRRPVIKSLKHSVICWLVFSLILPYPVLRAGTERNNSELSLQNREKDPVHSELTSRLKLLDTMLEGEDLPGKPHPLDPFRLLNQEVIKHPEFLKIKRKHLAIRFDDTPPGGAEKNYDFNSRGKDPETPFTFEDGFEIIYEGQVIHRFAIPIQAISFFGDYLIFLEKAPTYSKKDLQRLSFIDLAYFESALGKTDLPVFRLPVLTKNTVTRITQKKDELVFDNTTLTEKTLSHFSEVQQVAFNITVNLIDPRVYEETLPLVAGFDIYFNRALLLRGRALKEEIHSAAGTQKIIEDFQENLKRSLAWKAQTAESDYHEQHERLINTLKKHPFPGWNSLESLWLDAVENGVHLRSKLGNSSLNRFFHTTRKGKDLSSFDSSIVNRFEKKFIRFFTEIPLKKFKGEKKRKELLDDFLKKPENFEFILRAAHQKDAVKKITEKLGAENSERHASQLVSENLIAQRKLATRLRLLFLKMSTPRPLGAPRIKATLAFISGAKNHRKDFSANSIRKLAEKVLHHPYLRRGAPVVIAALAGAMYPEEVADFFHAGLDITRNIFEFALGRLSNLKDLGIAAATDTLEGIVSPSVLEEAYFAKGKLTRTAVGLGAIFGTLYITLFVPHLYVNTVRLVKDLRESGLLRAEDRLKELISHLRGKIARASKSPPGDLKESEFNDSSPGENIFSGTMKQAFIDRQNREQENYLATLSEAEGEITGIYEFNPEDDVEANHIVQELEKTYSNGPISRMRKKIANTSFSRRLSKDSSEKIENFRGALVHFLFSYASFTNSGYAYTKLWNSWFAMRSFLWSPLLWITFLTYPNYFKTVIRKNGTVTIPSMLNGGKRPFYEEFTLRLKAAVRRKKPVSGDSNTGNIGYEAQFSPSFLKKLRTWEEKIIPVEGEIHRLAVQKSFDALLGFIEDNQELHRLFLQNGISHVTDPTLLKLSFSNKTFFRAYFTGLYEKSMQIFLREILINTSGISPPENTSLKDLKIFSLDDSEAIKISPENAQHLVNEAISDGEIFERAKKAASGKLSSEAISVNFTHHLFKLLDPKRNRQVKRFQTVNNEMENPRAMARAVRAMIASIKVDKPMELLLIFFCLAGIGASTPLLEPIQESLFSNTSWFYLSRYVFFTGYIFGVLQGVLANTWWNLQVFELHGKKFDEIPDSDLKGGFYRHYLRKFFDPDNSLWKNQLHNIKIIWANMRAALATFLVIDLLTLGRLDLDSYLTGYLISYFTPISGLAFKLENSFELAGSYFAKSIPERLRSHPKIQYWLVEKLGKERIFFNVFYKLYENILGNLVGNFSQLTLPGIGKRALSRIIFFDYTPTEIVELGSQKLSSTLDLVPGANSAINTCKKLFTNNYEAFEKIKPR